MSRAKYHIALATANILFGVNFSFYVSLTRAGVAFQQIFFLQLLAAALSFTPSFATRPYRSMKVEDFGMIFIVALLVIYGWMYMLLWGASYTSPIDASTISTLGPVFTLLTACIVNAERVRWLRFVGIALALAGAATLLFDKGRSLVESTTEGYGNALVLCAVVAIAVNTILIRPQLRRYGVATVMGWYYTIGFIITLPFFWNELATLDLGRMSAASIAELLYVMFGGTVLPMYLLYVGAEQLSAVPTALYRYLQPIVATCLALLRGQSAIDTANIVGAALIFVGMILVVIAPNRSSQSACATRQEPRP